MGIHYTDHSVAMLRRGFGGQVLLPDAAGYDESRRLWNAMVDRRPAVVARPVSPSDVASAVRFGRTQGLDIGVRGGGHGIVGRAVPEDGLLIDLALLRAVRVEPDRRRAWVQGGALLGALDQAAQSFGLATTAGNVSHTGVGGLTLGGGMGWLARQFGLSCDNVAGFEVVCADGEIVHASETENVDLFWGLRGGGGNFGVVTDFEFSLHPINGGTSVVDLFYRPDDAPRAMRAWRDLIADAPRQATFTAWVGIAGAWPFLPLEQQNQPIVSLGYVWTGEPEGDRDLLPPLRAAGRSIAGRIQALSYLELQTVDDDEQGYQFRRYWKGHYLRQLSDDAIDAFVSRAGSPGDDPALLPSGSFQSHGGAIASVGADDTAFSHRDVFVEFVAGGRWTDPAEDEQRMAAGRRYGSAMEPFSIGTYVNTLNDEDAGGVRRAYRDNTLARLAELKARFDPDNVFRLNHNVAPAKG
jgi:FAD/FMN-containing dehydrogenase